MCKNYVFVFRSHLARIARSEIADSKSYDPIAKSYDPKMLSQDSFVKGWSTVYNSRGSVIYLTNSYLCATMCNPKTKSWDLLTLRLQLLGNPTPLCNWLSLDISSINCHTNYFCQCIWLESRLARLRTSWFKFKPFTCIFQACSRHFKPFTWILKACDERLKTK